LRWWKRLYRYQKQLCKSLFRQGLRPATFPRGEGLASGPLIRPFGVPSPNGGRFRCGGDGGKKRIKNIEERINNKFKSDGEKAE
jgi:hypothetical protein